ncbi:MAG: hypothetical protein JXA43_01560 [Candidatus Diapherotrites archaeon]|nr:hypothetical protein [Candidatus Diapherotrites archaeon]
MTDNPIVKIIEECPPFPGVSALIEKTENLGFTFEECISDGPDASEHGMDIFLHDVVAESFIDFMGTVDFGTLLHQVIEKEFEPEDKENIVVRHRELTREAFDAWFESNSLPQHLLEQSWDIYVRY